MNKPKRSSIKAAAALSVQRWTAPLLITVLLPAHAKTSHCTASSIAGEWLFQHDDQVFIAEMYSNGTGVSDVGEITWSSEVNTVIINTNITVYTGQINNRCDELSGTTTGGDSFVAKKGDFGGVNLPQ